MSRVGSEALVQRRCEVQGGHTAYLSGSDTNAALSPGGEEPSTAKWPVDRARARPEKLLRTTGGAEDAGERSADTEVLEIPPTHTHTHIERRPNTHTQRSGWL